MEIEIVAGGTVFPATLYDTETGRALWNRLPLTLDMRELNGNEKYAYLPNGLPVQASRPAGIWAGDLKLFGADCLVLFYQSFSTTYSYTPLGRIEYAQGLAAALGSGGVQVVIRTA